MATFSTCSISDLYSFFGTPLTNSPDFGMAIYDNVRIFFSHIISRVSVSAFFVMSGFLLFYRVDEFSKNVYIKKMKSRFKTILVPYLMWNAIYILQVVGFKLAKMSIMHQETDILGYFSEHGWLNMFWSCNVWPFRTSWFGWEMPSSGPILVPMWYLRDLMVCLLLSYIVYNLIKRFGLWYLGILFICSISGLWPSVPGLSAGGLLYFSIGAFMAINHKNLLAEFNKYKQIVLPVTLFLTVLMIYFKSDFTKTGVMIYPVFVFFAVISTFIIAGYLVQRGGWFSRHPRIFSRASFFVYASHTVLILGYCSKLMHNLLPGSNPAVLTVTYLLTPILCATVCVAMYYLMSRFTPRTLSLLTGNRS